jgi:hypothetical protein
LSCDLKLEASKAIFRELHQIKLLVDLPFELLSFEKGRAARPKGKPVSTSWMRAGRGQGGRPTDSETLMSTTAADVLVECLL